MQAEAPTASPSQRRQLILLAAQRLWGLDGYQAVSLRRIASEAGVALTLIDHHFGTKQQLFSTVLGSWRQVFTLPAERLQAVRQQGTPITLEVLVECLGEPARALQNDPRGQDVLRLGFRHLNDPTPEVRAAVHGVFGPVAEAFTGALAELYPDQPRGRIAWAYLFAIGTVFEFALHEVGQPGAPPEGAPAATTAPAQDALAQDELARFSQAEVVRFVVAGLQAALSSAPAAVR